MAKKIVFRAPSPPLKKAAPAAAPSRPKPVGEPALTIRPVRPSDLDAVIELDAVVTGMEKRENWNSLYRKYGRETALGQHFLVAMRGDEVIGFVIGEVRDWEFGSPPCGWVFAMDVRPDARLAGAATALLQAICKGFKKAGVSKVRTMLSRDNTLILSFFRSQGMMIAPFIPLEMDLED
ncbi:MAG: GNAT family N-acetyltransferase [Betaproteobacteria bacterium]